MIPPFRRAEAVPGIAAQNNMIRQRHSRFLASGPEATRELIAAIHGGFSLCARSTLPSAADCLRGGECHEQRAHGGAREKSENQAAAISAVGLARRAVAGFCTSLRKRWGSYISSSSFLRNHVQSTGETQSGPGALP